MKKIFAILFSVVLLTSCLVGCQGKKDNPGESSTSDSESVSQKNVGYDVTKNVESKTVKGAKKQINTASLISPYKTDEEKLAIKDVCVIRGKVLSSDYFIDEIASVYTKSIVEIEEAFVGVLKTGEKVTIWESGGFVPTVLLSRAIAKEKFGIEPTDEPISNEITDDRLENDKVLEKGEEAILFVVPYGNDSEFYGSYGSIRLWQGKMLYDEKLEAYVPYVPADELSEELSDNDAKIKIKSVGKAKDGVQARIYTLEEFRSFINENK